jgi:SAM-dependent methyltransferase
MSLSEHYDAKYPTLTEGFDQVPPLNLPPRDRIAACRAFLPQHFRGGSVLELGGNEGRLIRALIHDQVQFDRYVLTDLSAVRLTGVAESIGDPRVEVRALDADRLSDESGQYDAILAIALIEHLIDPFAALRECRRLLNPGGLVYIDTPNVAKWTRRIKLLRGHFPSTSSLNEGLDDYEGRALSVHDDGHLHYFTYASLEGYLRRVDFSDFHRYGYALRHATPKLAHHWPTLFSELCLVAR